ncbi:MlaD family protein [Patulibacter sp. NPDC049589]|uniref:MlaD family protein n=1 Tax=Patulibacter sp. NPDC049589 TaxID=3154731 RepID=UPI003430CACC
MQHRAPVPASSRRPGGRRGATLSRTPTAPRSRPLVPVALLGAVVVLVVVGAVLLLRGDPSHPYRLIFQNSSQVVKGGTVRIGGTQVGTISSIDLTADDRAEVRITVSGDFAPLRRGATAVVRSQGTAGVASRYVDVSPGSGLEPALRDGATIPVEQTQSQVELDQLFASFDGRTRAGLQKTIRGFAQWYAGREVQGGQSAQRLPKAMKALRTFAADVDAQSAQFEKLVVTSSRAMGALAQERDQLTGLVGGAAKTVDAIGADTRALNSALADTPQMLAQGSDALKDLRGSLPDLRGLVDASDVPSRRLTPFLRELRPVVDAAVPVFRDLRQVVDRPGTGNDLLDGLKDLPTVEKASRTAFPAGTAALKTSTPMLSFIRPYGPDLMSWFGSFGQAAGTYDANGHYVAAMPEFDAYALQDDAQGGTLVPKAPADRGRSDALSTGNLKRCPGSASGALPDGSGPFVDQGELANADCDPAETPVGK